MTVSPVTKFCAARGLGDLLATANVDPETVSLVDADPEFRATVLEQMKFQRHGEAPEPFLDGALLVLAARYAVGRMTAAVHEVADEIEAAWPDLNEAHRGQIAATVRERAERGHLGMAMDAVKWERILALHDSPGEAVGAPSV